MTLWEITTSRVASPVETPAGMLGRNAYAPRPYQIEDIQSIQNSWKAGKKSVLYRAATGLGKATVLGTIAALHRPGERVLCLINTVKLARQLRDTFEQQLGWTPGLIGGGDFDGIDRRVVIAVVQSLQVTKDGTTRAEKTFEPGDFGTLLIDECESALADGYMTVVRHFMNGNPDLHVLGCTATPIRGDGTGMGALFDHVVEEEGPLNRGPLWAFKEGWLVSPKQKFVQCSADFSTLKLRKGADGEADYSDEQIGKLLSDEKHLIEMAQAITRTAGEDRSIVVCPNNTEICDAIAQYINGQKPGTADSVHGKLRDPDAVMRRHQAGAFQFLCGVNMLTTGYDDPAIRNVFILRPTKSQRLFQQIIGRVFRPDKTIARTIGELPDAASRRDCIRNSVKPHCNVYCLVGVNPSTRDMTIVDLLLGRLTPEELERVKSRMLDGIAEDGEQTRTVEEVVKEVRAEIKDERASAQRRKIEVERAELRITDLCNQDVQNAPNRHKGAKEYLHKLGYKDFELDKFDDAEAKRLLVWEKDRARAKPALASKGQRRILESRGLPETEANSVRRGDAKKVIDEISKRERWGENQRGQRVGRGEVFEIMERIYVGSAHAA
jgi:superfamily II DNA or RNA helicase